MIAELPSIYGSKTNFPKRVVIHAMGEYIYTDNGDYHAKDFLDSIRLSAHWLITPSGVAIHCRQDNQGGYHAKGHNTDTIGIEILLAGLWDYEGFIERIKTPYVYGEQYRSLVQVCKQYEGLEFVRHSDIDPKRKQDPGNGFDWKTFIIDIGS